MGKPAEVINWATIKAPPARPFEPDFLEEYTESSILAELRRVATLTGREAVTARDLREYGRVDWGIVRQKFGTLHKALEAAGLKPTRRTKSTEDELLDLLRKLWALTLRRHGRSPRTYDLRTYEFPYSLKAIVGRFGSWRGAILQAAVYKVAKGAQPIAWKKPKTRRRRRRVISVRKRFLVFKRDGYRCRICGESGGVLEVDHVKPLARGGSNGLQNLQTLCRACNRGKRNDSEERKTARSRARLGIDTSCTTEKLR